jgi:serine phosphatase RsbU (regulator of sigma subunit)
MTDGITEATSHRNELFGQKRLEKYFRSASGPPWGRNLVGRVKTWRGKTAPSDDMTVFEIWREEV